MNQLLEDLARANKSGQEVEAKYSGVSTASVSNIILLASISLLLCRSILEITNPANKKAANYTNFSTICIYNKFLISGNITLFKEKIVE